ncbi:MAG: substrate-binding domain-containing protein [Acetobacteraceae bacterium]
MSKGFRVSRRSLMLSAGLAGMAGLAAPAGFVRQARAASKPYHIALSNSYIGNQWRIEMVNLTQAYARKYHPHDVALSVTSSGTEVEKEIAAMDDMISRHVDAILVDPASEAGLNPVIAEATRRGIVVVDFDHLVSAPSAYKVHVDFVKMGELQGKWLAEALGGKGNIIMNRGVPGFPGDIALHKGAMNELKQHPDIHVATQVFGRWDETVSQAVITKALIAHPNLDGVLNQYGAYGAVQAFLSLHRKFVPMTGGDSNGWRLAMLKYKDQGLRGISCGDSASLGAYALKIAVAVLDGKVVPKDIVIPIPTVTTDEVRAGVNAFPDLPPMVYTAIDIPGSGFQLTMNDALGK